MIDRFERFSYAVSEISRHWHKITSDEMAQYGLKGTHSIYLLTLLQYPEGLTALQLCELCDRDKADVSRMMAIMEKKGLVLIQLNGTSKYRGVFMLTESGLEAAKHVRQRASEAVEFAGKDLTDENRQIFYQSLASILQNLRELSKNGIPNHDKGETAYE